MGHLPGRDWTSGGPEAALPASVRHELIDFFGDCILLVYRVARGPEWAIPKREEPHVYRIIPDGRDDNCATWQEACKMVAGTSPPF